MNAAATTSYRGFTILVNHNGFIVLGRDGEPIRHVKTMRAARSLILKLRRAEREGA